jgi:hypothetical protein
MTYKQRYVNILRRVVFIIFFYYYTNDSLRILYAYEGSSGAAGKRDDKRGLETRQVFFLGYVIFYQTNEYLKFYGHHDNGYVMVIAITTTTTFALGHNSHRKGPNNGSPSFGP